MTDTEIREIFMEHGFKIQDGLTDLKSYVYSAARALLAAQAPAKAFSASELLDVDGENRAVRSFLMQYSCDRSISVKDMQDHMRLSGWDGCWPKWTTMHQGHLTKGGAQDWIRFLFSLESKADSAALQPSTQEVSK